MWLKSKCVCEREFVYLICTVLVSPLSADASRYRHLIRGELRRLLAYWAYEQRQSHHNTLYQYTHNQLYKLCRKTVRLQYLALDLQAMSFISPSISLYYSSHCNKHVYISLLLWSSRVIRLSAIDWLAIKCQVFPVGGNSAVLARVSWHEERERPQEGEASHPPLSHHTSWMRLPVLFFPEKNEG